MVQPFLGENISGLFPVIASLSGARFVKGVYAEFLSLNVTPGNGTNFNGAVKVFRALVTSGLPAITLGDRADN